MVELNELMDAGLQKRGWTQLQLAEYLGTSQQNVSTMRRSKDWAEHWRIFLRILPWFVNLDLMDAKEIMQGGGHGQTGKIFSRDSTKRNAPSGRATDGN